MVRDENEDVKDAMIYKICEFLAPSPHNKGFLPRDFLFLNTKKGYSIWYNHAERKNLPLQFKQHNSKNNLSVHCRTGHFVEIHKGRSHGEGRTEKSL